MHGRKLWCSGVRRASFALALGWLLAVAPAAAAFKYVEEGIEAPNFRARSLTGEEVELKARAGAKALAVVFWATWSPRSRSLLDDLEALYKERRASGLDVLAVNVDHEALGPEERRAVEDAARAWTFPVLMDEGLATYHAYGVVATPSLALLDQAHLVRFTRAGYSTAARQEVREAVDDLLGIAQAVSPRVAVTKRDYVPPKKATLHYQKAAVLVQRGMSKKAVRDLEEAAKLDENWAEPRILLARILLEGARKDAAGLAKAESALRDAVRIQPKSLQAHALLGETLLGLGRTEAAVAEAEAVLALEPSYTPALIVKARGLRVLGRLEDARKLLQEALEVDPRNGAAFAELGEVLAGMKRWEEASQALRQAVELSLGAGAGEG